MTRGTDQNKDATSPPIALSSGEHEALLTDASVHFTMTTHAGRNLNLAAAVRRLLAADVATAAAWPSESEVRVTPGLRKLALVIKSGQRLKDDLHSTTENPSLASMMKFSVSHPRVMLSALRKGQRLESDVDPRSPADANFGSIDGSQPHGAETPASESFEDAVDFGMRVLGNAQAIAAVEREVDASLFGGASRDRDEFVRLTLRGSYHDFRVPETEDTFHVVFEPRLLLHRSGVVQLTIAMPAQRDLSTTQLIELARSDRAVVVKSEIPEPLLKGLPAKQLRGRWLEEPDAGARLREMIYDDRPTMAESLERHLAAVGVVIGVALPQEWNTYATVFATHGPCCATGAAWGHEHQTDVAMIASRVRSARRLDHAKLTGKNFSIDQDLILMSNIGSTTRMELGEPSRAPFDELNTVLLVEHVLLQYFRLRSLEAAITRPNVFGSKLQALQQDAVRVFADMRQHELRYGTAREQAAHLLSELGGTEMRRTVEGGLNLASQANATHAATLQGRRSIALAWVGTILALLVAIPPLSQLLELAAAPHEGSFLANVLMPFRWAGGFGEAGPWLIVATLIAGVGLVWLLRKVWRILIALWRFGASVIRPRGRRLPRGFSVGVELSDTLPTSTETIASMDSSES